MEGIDADAVSMTEFIVWYESVKVTADEDEVHEAAEEDATSKRSKSSHGPALPDRRSMRAVAGDDDWFSADAIFSGVLEEFMLSEQAFTDVYQVRTDSLK